MRISKKPLRTKKDRRGRFFGEVLSHMPKTYQDIPIDGNSAILAKMTSEEREYLARFNDAERGRFYTDDFGPQYPQPDKQYIWRRMWKHRHDTTKKLRRDQSHTGATTKYGDDLDIDAPPYDPYDSDNVESRLIEHIDFKNKIMSLKKKKVKSGG